MTELVLNRGIPASGKSTYAKAWISLKPGRVRSNRDDIRYQMYGVYFGPPIDEDVVTKVQHAGIEAALSAGVSVIVDDCNIEPKFVKPLVALGHKYDADIRVVQHEVPVELAIERNRNRDRKVPDDVIRRMHSRLKRVGDLVIPEKTVLKPYVNDVAGKEKAILLDIDGTIAKMGGRGPFEWKRVGEDIPVQPVINTAKLYHEAGYKIIVMSGRDSVCRNETIEWLDKHLVSWDALFMRPEKDMRKDSIVKHELFWEHVAPFYNVEVCLDDRDQVVKAYRSMGLTVFQVAEGNF